MRKLIGAALICSTLGWLLFAGTASAGDCCGNGKPCCKQDTCTACKQPCPNKCESGKSNCKPACEPKCVKCKQDTCSSCKPKCEPDCQKPCCKPQADPCRCGRGHGHPYECCFTGTGMMCDTGCCGAPLICKRSCVECETVCKKIESADPCTGCVTVDYVYETVCHEVTRPRVIPWWFNDAGTGNIYPDEAES